MLHRFILFGWLLCAAVSSAQAQQFCNENVKPSAPDSRYRDNGDQTIADLATELIWKRCAEGLSGANCTIGTPINFSWQQALKHAASNMPWRLPNKKELASLVEQSCWNPSINSQFFPNTPPVMFWSSSPILFWSTSPDAFGSDSAWVVDFRYGDVGDNYKGNGRYVRLVRGGQ